MWRFVRAYKHARMHYVSDSKTYGIVVIKRNRKKEENTAKDILMNEQNMALAECSFSFSSVSLFHSKITYLSFFFLLLLSDFLFYSIHLIN
jgi:hypothetical protein